jgi:uncharacterized small protein (TIGR04563 family)
MTIDNATVGAAATTEKKSDPKGAKQSIYLPTKLAADLASEAARLDRSLSWLISRCCEMSLNDIRKMSSQAVDEE